MPFVKLDCGMLDSTIWVDREAREIFITALLMAEPYELKEPAEQIEVRSLLATGFVVPAGWYGFVPAAGTGIIRRAGIDQKSGIEALERLCGPESESRTPDHEGRRLARINGGYIVLNFDKYRQKDHTGAERQKRFRERHKGNAVTDDSNAVTERHITQAEAQAETEVSQIRISPIQGFDEFWTTYPRRLGKAKAETAWKKHKCCLIIEEILTAVILWKDSPQWKKDDGQFIPHPTTWLNRHGWKDELPTRQINKPAKAVSEMTREERHAYAFGK